MILTTAAAPHLADVHDRMPVVLAPQAWLAWLNPAATDAVAALELLRTHAVQALSATKIA